MHKLLPVVLFCATSSLFAAPKITDKSTEKVQVGYSFGYLLGKSNTNALNDLDIESFTEGFKQGFKGEKSQLSNEQMIAVLNKYRKDAEASEMRAFHKEAEANLKIGTAFLENNAKKQGIKTTKSGLQYEVLQQGSGKRPKLNNTVEVHYEGRLIDGTVFDSSIARDKPISLQLDQVIKGWQEGLQLMPEGSNYRFYVPAKLAYGELGSGDAIPPNSTLIFDIQLLKINS